MIVVNDFPLSNLYEVGLATVPVPLEIASKFYDGSEALEWPTKEYVVNGRRPAFQVYPNNTIHPHYAELVSFVINSFTITHPNIKLGEIYSSAQKVLYGPGKASHEGNWNTGFHVDCSKMYPRRDEYINDQIKNPRRAPVCAVISLPLNIQKPTICIPFGGKYKGLMVEGKPESITFAMFYCISHTANAQPGNRIVLRISFTPADVIKEEDYFEENSHQNN